MPEIDAILEHYPPDVRPLRIERLGSAGGMSGAQFWRITAPRGILLLRRWPPEHPPPERLRFNHAVLRHAAQRGIAFLPLPFATRDGETFVEHAGYLWELAPFLPGAADYERAPSHEKLRAAMRALAEFHLAVADFVIAGDLRVAGAAPAVTRRLARLHDLAHGGIDELSGAVRSATWPDLAPLAEKFLAAVPRAVPRAIAQFEPLAGVRLPLQVCIRDIWHDHVLFTGNEVTGLIDFGAAGIDTPATDIARLLGSLVQGTVPFSREAPTDTPFESVGNYDELAKRGLSPSAPDEDAVRSEGLSAYSAVRPLSPPETQAARALDAAGTILAGCNWIRWIYIDERQFENKRQVIERFGRILSRIAVGSEPRSGEIA